MPCMRASAEAPAARLAFHRFWNLMPEVASETVVTQRRVSRASTTILPSFTTTLALSQFQ